jgi:catalase-peroxidase
MGEAFDYAEEFKKLDLAAVKKDLARADDDSQDWWPADYGHYGPFFIRMAWHSAGTYRVADGRGGAGRRQQRFAPLNSWPDNANLDKARRLLWPIKQKYGSKISWADLMVLTGNVALESMGFKTFGFAGGRQDVWEPRRTSTGARTEWLGDKRYSRRSRTANPLAAVQMGLIYVNPEGPNGNPDPLLARQGYPRNLRSHGDERRGDRRADRRRPHLRQSARRRTTRKNVGPEPEGCPLEEQGLGWKNSSARARAEDTITSGLEGAWTANTEGVGHGYFDNLFAYEWELTKSPAGAQQWKPKRAGGRRTVPDAHDPTKRHAPIMRPRTLR